MVSDPKGGGVLPEPERFPRLGMKQGSVNPLVSMVELIKVISVSIKVVLDSTGVRTTGLCTASLTKRVGMVSVGGIRVLLGDKRHVFGGVKGRFTPFMREGVRTLRGRILIVPRHFSDLGIEGGRIRGPGV